MCTCKGSPVTYMESNMRWYGTWKDAQCVCAEDWDTSVVTKEQYDTVVRLVNKAKVAVPATPPAPTEHPSVTAFKKWCADTLPVIEAQAAGKVVECGSRSKDTWSVKSSGVFHTNFQYRIKPEPPKTININRYKVPEPLRVAPAKGTPVYIVGVHALIEGAKFKWDDGTLALRLLQAGMLHLTKEAAEMHTQALTSFTQERK